MNDRNGTLTPIGAVAVREAEDALHGYLASVTPDEGRAALEHMRRRGTITDAEMARWLERIGVPA